MMASPAKHVSINMEEKRPLLEAQVNSLIHRVDYNLVIFFLKSQVVALSH